MNQPDLRSTSLGPLQATMTSLAPDEVRRTIVLLHGYGAPGTDLVGLAPHLLEPGTQLVFPAGPLQLAGPRGRLDAARAWWPIDMGALQMARFTGHVDVISREPPEGLESARELLDQTIGMLQQEHGLRFESTFIGGFSQGAMLSADWSLRSAQPLAGLIQLSGTLICSSEWPTLMKQRPKTPVFQSHSPDDVVLPYALAEKVGGMWRDAGHPHQFLPFRGGHGIGPDVLAALRDFLAQNEPDQALA